MKPIIDCFMVRYTYADKTNYIMTVENASAPVCNIIFTILKENRLHEAVLPKTTYEMRLLMFNVKEIDIPEQKAYICDAVLHALPSWFGVESSIVDYMHKVQTMPFWAAFNAEKPVGFVALKVHNSYTSEVYVMGVLKEYHQHGIGRQLIGCCEAFCFNNSTEFLTVKTLDTSAASKSYAKTIKFYSAMGFRPLEVFPLHWGKGNPCLFMAKRLPTPL